jgi:hypothetical protein
MKESHEITKHMTMRKHPQSVLKQNIPLVLKVITRKITTTTSPTSIDLYFGRRQLHVELSTLFIRHRQFLL